MKSKMKYDTTVVVAYLDLVTIGINICTIRSSGDPVSPTITQRFIGPNAQPILVLKAEVRVDGENKPVEPPVKFSSETWTKIA